MSEQDDLRKQLETELKNYYRPAYMQAAKSQLGFRDAFRGAAARLAKVEKIAEAKLQEDFDNGTLEKRMQAETTQSAGQEQQQQPAATPRVFEAGEFGFLDITEELADPKIHPADVPKEFSVQIPNVAKLLLEATDDTFLNYVLENLDSYDVATPGFIEAPEVRAGKKGGHDLFISVVAKKFRMTDAGFARDEAGSGNMLLLHSDTQMGLVQAGSNAINSFNASGTIPQRLREVFIVEQAKETLRTSGYAMTEQYENFCMDVMRNVVGQIDMINGHSPAGLVHGYGGYTVSAKIDFGTAAPKKAAAQTPAPKAAGSKPKP